MTNPDLARLYFDYAMAHQSWLSTPASRRTAAEQKRDLYWTDYLNAGGTLPPLEGHDASHAEFAPIQQGERSERVKELQLLLGMPPKARDGAFGRTTRRWVEDFQKRHNLAPSGSVDATTWGLLRERPEGALSSSSSPQRDVANGPTLQFALTRPGSSVMLALDATSERTYCNTFNLALFALLVYADDGADPKTSPLDDLRTRVNEGGFEMMPLELRNGTRWRPLLRATDPGHSYSFSKLNSADTNGKPHPQATTADPDGGKDEAVVIDSQGRFWRGVDHAVIALRGTQQLPPDVLTDVTAGKVRWPYGVGHVCRGFWLAFEVIRDQIDKEMRALQPRTMPIFVTGHSLGGALAHLTALYLRARYRSHPVILYTFAQPRCIDRELAEATWADPMLTHYRFESPVDPIPMVPSWRTARDLVDLLGDMPDTLLPRARDAVFWVALAVSLTGGSIGAVLSKYGEQWGNAQIDAFEQVASRYRRLVAQFVLNQSQGTTLSFAELAPVLAPPDMDPRHTGVRCRFTRRGGRPMIEQDLDRTIETLVEIDTDNLATLIRHVISEAKGAIRGELAAAFMEAMSGLPAPEGMRKDKLQLQLDPRAHSMNNYMAHVLFEFDQHPAYVQGQRDPVLPLSVGPLEIMEPAYFHGHYFGRQRFWGDHGEDADVKIVDGEVSLW